MHSSKPARVESFARLIELGGGKVVDAQPPFADPKGATHCLLEKGCGGSADYGALASHGVAVVTPVYLNAYLVSDPPPKVDEYLPEDYKPFWAKRK